MNSYTFEVDFTGPAGGTVQTEKVTVTAWDRVTAESQALAKIKARGDNPVEAKLVLT